MDPFFPHYKNQDWKKRDRKGKFEGNEQVRKVLKKKVQKKKKSSVWKEQEAHKVQHARSQNIQSACFYSELEQDK